MLDRDRKPTLWRAYSLYAGALDFSSYSSPSYSPLSRQLSIEGDSLGRARVMWMCPHRIFDYFEARKTRETTDIYRCERSSPFTFARYGDTFFSTWTILKVPPEFRPSCEEVREALHSLDAPVCPHLRLNDTCIWRGYDPDCQKLDWKRGRTDSAPECRCQKCSSGLPRTVICNFCDARTVFDIMSHHHWGPTLDVCTVRSTRSYWHRTDRAWLAQTANPADFEEYKRAWQATHAECLRRVGPR